MSPGFATIGPLTQHEVPEEVAMDTGRIKKFNDTCTPIYVVQT